MKLQLQVQISYSLYMALDSATPAPIYSDLYPCDRKLPIILPIVLPIERKKTKSKFRSDRSSTPVYPRVDGCPRGVALHLPEHTHLHADTRMYNLKRCTPAFVHICKHIQDIPAGRILPSVRALKFASLFSHSKTNSKTNYSARPTRPTTRSLPRLPQTRPSREWLMLTSFNFLPRNFTPWAGSRPREACCRRCTAASRPCSPLSLFAIEKRIVILKTLRHIDYYYYFYMIIITKHMCVYDVKIIMYILIVWSIQR